MFRLSLFVCVIACCIVARPSSADVHRLQEGDVAPDWMMTDIEGHNYSLYQELDSGRQVVMVFWSTWCKFCKVMLPEMNLFKQSLDDDTRIFALNIWESGDPVAYFDTRNIDIPLMLRADDIADRYKIDSTPGLVFIGTDKRIRYIRSSRENLSDTMRHLQLLVIKDRAKHASNSGG
ncbi:TlpA family protein disulfide reductase [Teredinibacter turnerae]|uniref:Thiol-disulfide oxidoreductase n=1 Tax=Teredinibacter turnerae (strain ATCC 39867 / T7901) TaxID=377629 RepID=C5BTN3_TERTT|nr:thioredoxin fold domain-containing protein [Teredinibacter turnerae]ACR10948.1 putative thiol-disulfide oxidoreductase [Teredinibacter turnerae T7901]